MVPKTNGVRVPGGVYNNSAGTIHGDVGIDIKGVIWDNNNLFLRCMGDLQQPSLC